MTPYPRRPVVVIGLDGAEPELVFDRWRSDLPVLDALMREGIHGRMESTVPAITVPAWASMMTGRDPGELGIYGFRNRVDHSYDRLAIADSTSVLPPRIWDLVGAAGGRVGVVSVPQTYPVRPVNGHLVSCFLTPGPDSRYAYPLGLKAEIQEWIGEPLLVDVPDFRSTDKERILRDIHRMADQHFTICRRLLERERYDFFMTVDMGVDRAHHALWRYMDPRHPAHEPDHPLRDAIHDYYVHVDQLIGSLLEVIPDDAIVLVVSDHGGQSMQGGLCVNEWLIERGMLALDAYPDRPTPRDAWSVRWDETDAWGEGGYYGRVFMNVEGREPSGRIPAAIADATRARLVTALEGIADDQGRTLETAVYRPEELYRSVQRIPPDLLVYFDELRWRSVGSVGHRRLWTFDNDTGPDDANHAQHGIFIYRDPLASGGGRMATDRSIYDMAPTLMSLLGIDVPPGLRGRPMADLPGWAVG